MIGIVELIIQISLSIVILIGLFYFEFFLNDIQNAYAAQKAIVRNEVATIYADKEFKIPIGKTIRGKTILVGDVAEMQMEYEACPIIVEGKIAYIERGDVELESEKVKKERAKRKVETGITTSQFNDLKSDNAATNNRSQKKSSGYDHSHETLTSENEAIINSDANIIYADPELKIPIGKALHGMRAVIGKEPIVIGDRKIYSIIVGDRIAYIDETDLKLKDNKESRENLRSGLKAPLLFGINPNSIKGVDVEKIIQPLDESNTTILFAKKGLFVDYKYLSLNGLKNSYDKSGRQASGTSSNENKANMVTFGMEFWPRFSYAMIFAATYLSHSSQECTVSSYGAFFGGRIRIYRLENLFDTFISFSGQYHPSFNYTDKSRSGGIYYQGSAVGFSLGGQLIRQVLRNVDVRLGLEYNSITVSELSEKNNSNETMGATTNSSYSIMIGLGYYYFTEI